MNYNIWLVARNGSVSLNLLIPQYGYLASLACFYWFWYIYVPVFFCPIVPLCPCICWSVVVHSLYRVFLGTVLLPLLGMPILHGLFSHRIVGKVCICYIISIIIIIITIIVVIAVVVGYTEMNFIRVMLLYCQCIPLTSITCLISPINSTCQSDFCHLYVIYNFSRCHPYNFISPVRRSNWAEFHYFI